MKSIALVPSVMALCFLFLAILLSFLEFDYSRTTWSRYFVIDKKEDIQSIFSWIIGGIFTLTIFSYTMVMNVLNRNINNYSPRLVPMLLSEKHHQLILGFTSGTIVYCLVLSLELNNVNDDYFPGIAASIGIFFTICCVFLFIYFIHSVSQSIHINYILEDVFVRTKNSLLQQSKYLIDFVDADGDTDFEHEFGMEKIGHLHGYNIGRLEKFVDKRDIRMRIEKIPGTFLQTSDKLLKTDAPIEAKSEKKLRRIFAIDHEVPLDVAEIGFKHLVEVAIKASSPAINDPATSKTCIDYLTQLFIIRINGTGDSKWVQNKKGNLVLRRLENQLLLRDSYLEMHRYMKDDYLLPKVLAHSLKRIKKDAKREVDINIGTILSHDPVLQ
ncbi:MAG: DUF2254 family protein [Pricia sp.]